MAEFIGKIYKVFYKNDANIFYVGATTYKLLNSRLSAHKCWSKKYPNRKFYKNVIEKGGWDNFEIQMLEECKCKNRCELDKKEEYWISTLNPPLNKNSANYQPEERKDKRKVHMKKYHDEHLVEIKEYKKKHTMS